MRIALVSTCAVATPPAAYGGTELVVAELAKGLTALGHDVVTFATGDSKPAGTLHETVPSPCWPPDDLAEERHAAMAFRDIGREAFDVVQVNHPAAAPFAMTIGAPCVATVHHDRISNIARHYAALRDVSFVAISQSQADLCPEVPFARVIHHGLDPSLYPEGDGEGDYAAFLGRFAPSKGPHVAIDVARAAGLRIVLGGAAHEVEDAQSYFRQQVAPRLAAAGSGADWRGEASHGPKLDILRRARALLFPIEWDEPFGLVMIEAMLVGTPVIAFRRGSTSEVIEEGVTGFLVDSEEEMTSRLAALGSFDRARCRGRALERWTTQRMARDYERLFSELVDARTSRAPLGSNLPKVDHGTALVR